MNAGHATALHGMSSAAGTRLIAALVVYLRSPGGMAARLMFSWILGAAVCIAAPPVTDGEFRDKTPRQPDNTQRANTQRGNNDRSPRREIQQASGERRVPFDERDTESPGARDNSKDDPGSSHATATAHETTFSSAPPTVNPSAEDATGEDSTAEIAAGENAAGENAAGEDATARLFNTDRFNDDRSDNPDGTAATTGGNLQQPRKLPERDASKRFAASPASTRPSTGNVLWSAAGWLSIIVAAILISGRFLLRNAPSVAGFLPPEAMQVLGRRTLAPRFSLHLVRCGRRILIIGSHPQGLTSLGEVTDPAEVDHLAGLCTPSPGSSPTQTFAALFNRFSTGPAPKTDAAALDQYAGSAAVNDADDRSAARDDSDGFGVTTEEVRRDAFGLENTNPTRPFAERNTADQLRDRIQQRLATDSLLNEQAAVAFRQSSAPVPNQRDRSRQEPRSA